MEVEFSFCRVGEENSFLVLRYEHMVPVIDIHVDSFVVLEGLVYRAVTKVYEYLEDKVVVNVYVAHVVEEQIAEEVEADEAREDSETNDTAGADTLAIESDPGEDGSAAEEA